MTIPITPRAAYEALGIEPATADRLEDCASRIEAGAKLTGEGILQIGAALNEARAEFGDNDRAFGQWRKARLPWLEERTALRFQQVSERFGTDPRQFVGVSRMPRSVLYALAAPSTPNEVIDQALDRVEIGERVTLATVRELMARAEVPAAPASRRPAVTVQRASQRLGDELRRFTGDLAGLPASSADDRAPLHDLAQWLEAALGAVRGRLWTIDERASPSVATILGPAGDTLAPSSRNAPGRPASGRGTPSRPARRPPSPGRDGSPVAARGHDHGDHRGGLQ